MPDEGNQDAIDTTQETTQETAQESSLVTGGESGADSQPEPSSETKSDESSKTPEPKTVNYELSLPEGSTLNDESIEQIKETAKALQLNNEQAQQLLNERNEAVSSAVESFKTQQMEQYHAQRDQWADATKSDEEIGGDNFDASVSDARKAIEKFGSDAFKKALDETGFGDHPEVVRVFARVGKAMSEDKIHFGGDTGEGPTAAQRMFPSASDGYKPEN